MGFFQNYSKPRGFIGSLMLSHMNRNHGPSAQWGLSHIQPPEGANVLDIGCGGGANMARLMELCPRGFVTGMDYSPLSVDASKDYNRKALAAGRGMVLRGDVSHLAFPRGIFDLVTAFETIYFWPQPDHCFHNIWKTLKDGGQFLICNTSAGEDEDVYKWARKIDGMVVYKVPALEAMLKKAGFSRVETDIKGSWLTMVATK